MTKPVCAPFAFTDAMGIFSVDCTLEYLMADEGCRKILEPMMQMVAEGTKEKYSDRQMAAGDHAMAGAGLVSKMSLRNLLGYGDVPEELVDQLDQQLRALSGAAEG